jgi:hypothetical protein
MPGFSKAAEINWSRFSAGSGGEKPLLAIQISTNLDEI